MTQLRLRDDGSGIVLSLRFIPCDMLFWESYGEDGLLLGRCRLTEWNEGQIVLLGQLGNLENDNITFPICIENILFCDSKGCLIVILKHSGLIELPC